LCFEGDFEKEIPTQAQIDAGLELVAYLKKKYNIKKVKGHGELMASSCPGKLFPMEKFIGEKENLILSFQRAAVADGIKFKQYGCDGKYGIETEAAMKQCVVKRRLFYKYKNATKLLQRLLGITQDGLCGKETSDAIKNFQKKNNLTPDGCCGEETWKKLLKIS
jgi:peptidoglycan hydrolase-like protein with peptidoglycan-binding domain